MTLLRWQVVNFGMFAALAGLLSACSTSAVDIGYAPDVPVPLLDEQAATFEVGQFTDRRQKPPNWVGEIRGAYHYPKTILAADRTVAELVREIVEQGAYDRGMIDEDRGPSRYQFYGQIIRADGIETEDSVVHVHLVSRLIDLETNRQLHVNEHKIDRVAPLDITAGYYLNRLIEEALNDVVAASLDDPVLRQILVSIDQEN